MKHYLRIYSCLLRLNLAALVAYRVNFINSFISSLSWAVFSIISIVILTSKTKVVFGWSRDELIILTGAYSIVIGVFHAFFSRNFELFSDLVFFGKLDTVLTKPADDQFLLSFWRFSYSSLARVLLGIGFTLWMIIKNEIALTLMGIIGFFVLMIVGIVIIYAIWFTTITLTIWFPRLSNLVHLLFLVTGFARYPAEMYYGLKTYILFFLLPIILVVSTPTKALLNKTLQGEVLDLIAFAIMLFFCSRLFWKFALKHYTSASS